MRHLFVAATLAAALPFAGLPSQFEKIARAAKGCVGVAAQLLERAPAGEIFVVQAVADVALAEIISEVLLVLRDGFFGRERFAVH